MRSPPARATTSWLVLQGKTRSTARTGMTDFSAGRVGTCLTAAPGATGACKPSDGSRVRDLCGVRDAHVEQRIAERPDGPAYGLEPLRGLTSGSHCQPKRDIPRSRHERVAARAR